MSEGVQASFVPLNSFKTKKILGVHEYIVPLAIAHSLQQKTQLSGITGKPVHIFFLLQFKTHDECLEGATQLTAVIQLMAEFFRAAWPNILCELATHPGSCAPQGSIVRLPRHL